MHVEIAGCPFGGLAVMWHKDKFNKFDVRLVNDRLLVCVRSGGSKSIHICNLCSPNAGTDMESKVIYFDFQGDLFHKLSLLTEDKIVMGDFYLR